MELLALSMCAAVLFACGDDESSSSDTTEGGGGGGDCVVGVSWNNYQEERWAKFDEPAIKEAVEAGGGTYVSNDAKSSAETQATNVENLISQGANVLIILAQDGTAIKPSVASAIEQGMPVIGYDRLIEDTGALYITFDNVEVGRLQAQAIFDEVPTGNYIIIKGNRPTPTPTSSAPATRRSSVTPWRLATSRSSARPTRTTGTRPLPRPRPSSS